MSEEDKPGALKAEAIAALRSVMENPEASGAARAAAARTMLEYLGLIGRLATTHKSSERRLSEMTPDELDAAIAALQGARVVPFKKR